MTTININGVPFASQPMGTKPQDGDELLDGVLYRMVKIQTPAQKAGNKPPAQKPEEKTPAPKTEVKPPAPKVEEKAPVKTEPKAPVKAEDKAPVKTEVAPVKKDNTNRNLFIAAFLVILALLAWNLLKDNGGNRNGGSNTSPITVPADGSNSPAGDTVSEATVLNLGSIGTYHAVYDSNENKWTLGIWETSMTSETGKGLSEFKLRATSVSFVMPADGTINNSADHISVNNVDWTPGNPAVDANGNSLVTKGSNVTIWTDGPNASAGFQIWFNK